MALKITLALATLLAICHGDPQFLGPLGYGGLHRLGYARPPLAVARPPVAVGRLPLPEEYDPHPTYNFQYNVGDPTTGDFKSQHESRDGDLVQGSYSLAEADGSTRVVEYTADPVHGFNAVVRKEGVPHPPPVPVARPPVVGPRPLGLARPVVGPLLH